jgi:hypothetical protein
MCEVHFFFSHIARNYVNLLVFGQIEKNPLYLRVVPPFLMRFTRVYLVGGFTLFAVAPSVLWLYQCKIRRLAHSEAVCC